MRTLLIIIGLIFILGLLAHGLWTIRKTNRVNQQRQARREAAQRRIDESGFDEYGIGKVRTIQRTEQGTSSAMQEQAKEQPEVREKVQEQIQDHEDEQEPLESVTLSESKPKPQAEPTKSAPETPVKTARKEPTVHVEQLPMDFDLEDSEPHVSELEPITAAQDDQPLVGDLDVTGEDQERMERESQHSETPMPEQEVITLFVSGDIQGAILLQTVTELGFKFGEMDIFHRHEDTSGKGPVLFSMANMFNPGVFNLDEIETFSTRGVALFMTLPLKSDGHKAFTMMYNAANKIAEAMPRAAVLDGNRNPITKQSVQHTYQKIREFERRQHVAGKHH